MGDDSASVAPGTFTHQPVLMKEVLELLAPGPGKVYVDATVGGGGHAAAVLEQGVQFLLGVDRDPMALQAATERLGPFGARVALKAGRASALSQFVEEAGLQGVDGVLADLGVSSPQLDRAERGFSFRQNGPLDMRMEPSLEVTAADIVNRASERELTRIFREYGEERHASRVAFALVKARGVAPIATTLELAHLVERAIPGSRGPQRIHPATRVFQALRIVVNQELTELSLLLDAAYRVLRPGGRLVIIAFHSLEDRIVKDFFRTKAASCVCPLEQLVCQCGKRVELRILTPRPWVASEGECAANPRARSARVRGAEKI